MIFNSLLFNLANAPIRRETLHGKQYVVAPMAMLTEGVHKGSGGPLLYRENECKKAVAAWNMKPIVVYHPNINGQGVSACDPDILEKQQVGMVMNCIWNGKLRADAWIEESRANLIDNRVIDALDNNKMMEVSTGLFTDNVGGSGEFNGTAYDAEAVNHQPDHLALLPDQIGACSINDGAGLLQMNEAAAANGFNTTDIIEQGLNDIRLAIGNAMHHSDINNAANLEGVETITTASSNFVDNKNETLETKELNMKKEEMVAALIANEATPWTENDAQHLMAFDEDTLQKVIDNAEVPAEPEPEPELESEPVADPVENTEVPVAQTAEEYIAAAPEGIRDVLTNSLAVHQAQKLELIKTIRANKANVFSEAHLTTKGLQELQGLAALATPAPAPQETPVPMFAPQVPFTPTENADQSSDEALGLPVMNFEDAK